MSLISTNPIEEEFFPTSNWELCKVERMRDGSRDWHHEMVDKKTLDRYRHEDWNHVSIKCALLTYGTMIHGVGALCWNIIKLPFNLFSVPIEELYLYANGANNFTKCVEKIASREVEGFGRNVWNITRIPFYCLALQLCAIFGVFCPYEGRKQYATVEKAFNHGLDRKSGFKDILDRKNEDILSLMGKSLLKTDDSIGFFMAYCFQPIGNLQDKDITKVTRLES